MRIRLQLVVCTLAVAAVAPARADGPGLVADPASVPWGRFQGRVAYAAAPAWRSDLASADASGLKLSGASVMGDVYLASTPGGFRATSGVFLGSRAGLWGSPAGTPSTARLGIDGRVFAAPLAPAGDWAADTSTLPYLGVGYSSLAGRGGWRFSADLGVVSLSPGNASRLGRVFGGGQNLDDVVRDMRLAPVVQLGASYSF